MKSPVLFIQFIMCGPKKNKKNKSFLFGWQVSVGAVYQDTPSIVSVSSLYSLFKSYNLQVNTQLSHSLCYSKKLNLKRPHADECHFEFFFALNEL